MAVVPGRRDRFVVRARGSEPTGEGQAGVAAAGDGVDLDAGGAVAAAVLLAVALALLDADDEQGDAGGEADGGDGMPA
jgi:hypothetical protein